MRILLISSLLMLPLAAFGQLDDNTLTVTSSRALTFQPDQVAISVTASFESTAALDDVLAAVASAGITLANLSNVSTYNLPLNAGQNRQTNEWFFVLQVPFSKLGGELTSLGAVQQSIGKNSARSLSYYVQGTQVSPQLSATGVCPYAALFQDAGAQAQTLASAAGVMLGPVVAVSDGSSVYPAIGVAVGYLVPTAAFRVGDFQIADPLLGAPVASFSGVLGLTASAQTTCTLSVQFRLQR
jgi:hypothetical protein